MRLILLVLLILFAACDRVDPPAVAEGRVPGGPDAVRSAAAYDRRLLFLAGVGDERRAAVFDFSVLVDSAVSRTARAWLGRNGTWEAFLDLAWEMDPMRDPWRLVPHGPLQLVVGEGNEIETLLYQQGARELRLLPGPAMAEWSPGGGAQFRMRQAELWMGGERLGGTLLDVQIGREVPSRGVAAPDTVLVAGEVVGYDHAFLIDDDGVHVVITSNPSEGASAWLRRGDQEETFEGTRLEWIETEPFEEARRNVPAAWRLVAPRGGLTGELRSVGRDLTTLPGDAARPAVRGLYAVTGWIEVRGRRHDVFGIVRHGQG